MTKPQDPAVVSIKKRKDDKIPELELAAKALLSGVITRAEYDKTVKKLKPVTKYESVPRPATDEEALGALKVTQKPHWRGTDVFPEGHPVGLRLDIPAYSDHGVWVNSVHDESGAKTPVKYAPVSAVRNAEFDPGPSKAQRVATGETNKSPFARIKGEWQPMTDKEAVAHMQKHLSHPDYVQVGYDPRRRDYFYHRGDTRKPITHAEHVVQIGPLVLAKNPVYGKRKDFGLKDGGTAHMDKGGDLSKYRDPKSEKIADWKWRKMQDVGKDVPIREIPDYIQRGYGEFMKQQRARAQAGELSPRDLLKAFTITQSSIGRGGLSHATATKSGMKLPNTGGEVRPEGAFAEWLGSPMGQKYLNAAEQGLIDPAALSDIQQKFSPFGKHNQLIDQMAYAAHTIPGMAKGLNQAVIGSTDEYRDWAEKLKGIAGAKSGFIGSMLGRGDLPTLDARQLNLHTLPAKVGVGSIMSRGKGKGAREAVDRLAARQKAMNLGIDPSMAPHYQHLAHHAVWDAVGNNKTTHDDLVRAMRGYAKGGTAYMADGGNIDQEDPLSNLPPISPQQTASMDKYRLALWAEKNNPNMLTANNNELAALLMRNRNGQTYDDRSDEEPTWRKSQVNPFVLPNDLQNMPSENIFGQRREMPRSESFNYPRLEKGDDYRLPEQEKRKKRDEIARKAMELGFPFTGTYYARGGRVTHAHHLDIEERPL